MAIALVGTANSAYAAAVTRAAVTSGNLVIFFAACAGGGTNPPFATPTKTGTCTIGAITNVVNYSSGDYGEGVGIWWMKVTGDGSLTLTINLLGGANDTGGSIHEYSGADTTAPIDASDHNEGADSSAEVALTGVLAGSVVVMVASEENNGGDWTATAPYTRRTNETDHSHCTVDYIVPSDGSYTPQATQVGATGWVAGAAAFLAAAAPSATQPPRSMHQFRQRRD